MLIHDFISCPSGAIAFCNVQSPSVIMDSEERRDLVANARGSFLNPPVPEQFVCPITMEVMHDPVSTSDGQARPPHALQLPFPPTPRSSRAVSLRLTGSGVLAWLCRCMSGWRSRTGSESIRQRRSLEPSLSLGSLSHASLYASLYSSGLPGPST